MGDDIWIAVALAEGLIIAVLVVLLVRSSKKVAALRRENKNRAAKLFLSGSRDAVKTVWNTANVVRTRGIGAAVRTSVEDLAGWAQVERPDLARLTVDGRVTILFSDIEGSTTLNEHLGDQAWVKLLTKHDNLVRKTVDAHNGHVIKSQGDGFMIAFGSSDDAVLCALEVQEALHSSSWAARNELRVRIGIHSGSSVRRGDDLFGRNVAMAARVESQAKGAETLISEPVRRHLSPELPVDVVEERQVELKGFDGTHTLYRVQART
ncbi:adenylate/guanylate cyclase domain-containing protein [Hoyosella rhizosphaerae]|uniref:Guanylate cyclase domain-containing protein n=1 Tax=Hoyosella rhizosphaerae TaxID=1755582 RepID=A0A916UBL0_9ACTN|nr:adenylate/guanylate cyclase domain-containing protein [Hoyosella rhizosphaerae]MBN4925826.1 adenylate/guanylate cyclase domain-containing protein [Hoyosella rhizosphaerae]GGC67645.1 hypothetical protein GCM10011410_20440 [Hoyosella rhizosphaerae]